MHYRNLGKSGLKVSELSFGTWLTFGDSVDERQAALLCKTAVEHGVNFFDCAEVYAKGRAEEILGQVLKDYRREEIVVSTKIFWGGEGPNRTGLSRKRLVEGTRASLKRLRMEYVDLLFCHRPDPETPVEETVRAMDWLIQHGMALYWGTSEWPKDKIEEAYRLAADLRLTPPTMEQPHYNMLVRERVEQEYASLYSQYGMGTTTWSPLASGVLTGKYLGGIPSNSRLGRHEWLQDKQKGNVKAKVEALQTIAKDMGVSMAQLAIGWCLKNPNVSTVILGASKLGQLEENLRSSLAKDQLNDIVMAKIKSILESD